ncbi:jg4313 [Pararge aegeria aegeria]|uniref:Jg4313 protein n=1 Tax=Pararge aegeria aegeria TaxID=348720 RepID=A0A8S4RET0_9NEOP|nr:jg4313 [Pararge aegeria aegeria]
MRSASYAFAEYPPRRDPGPYGAPRFDGKKAKGVYLEQTALRNISYRIPKGRQPCDDVPYSEVFYWLGHR